MARQRLGVVLLVPHPIATQVDGIRRALGDGALGRIEPHITLVPPVNVAERDLSKAFALVRAAAATVAPLALRVGPVATFAPVNPVAYLRVGGDPAALDALEQLRTGCLQGPLDRPQDHDFVPHVTVADDLAAARLDAVAQVLGDFSADVTFDRVHVLAELPGRVWRPVADSLLGERPAAVGRGSLPLDLVASGRPDVEAAALLSFEEASAGTPFAITAYRDGQVVAAAWGWTARGVLELADVAVALEHRGQGVGRHVVAAVEALGARRGCAVVGASAPATGASAALLAAVGFRMLPPAGDGVGPRRWEHVLAPAGPEAGG
jgi:2'-5' RNA ligase/GNAT superfamily N-acetyltransferase